MKALALALAIFGASVSAKADGFKCQTVGGDLMIQVYNETQPALGTRNAAVLVLSDASVQHGRKAIAVLRAEDGLLWQENGLVVGKVDLRFKESDRKGENIAGTKLGSLKQIRLALDFTYGDNLADGEELGGLVTFVKRNGQEYAAPLACTRYLKN
ncbi:MAG: hypothetical protein AAB250_06110 [Bdellovibrionota bacterium]